MIYRVLAPDGTQVYASETFEAAYAIARMEPGSAVWRGEVKMAAVPYTQSRGMERRA